jgi:hypothetical protein
MCIAEGKRRSNRTAGVEANVWNEVGERKIEALRAEAAQALPGFDVRRFHDLVLENGSVPLPTLRRIVRAWVASGGR